MARFSIRFIAVALGLALWLPSAAQSQTKRLTVEDIFELELAVDPRISPDGSRIIYVRQFADIMTDGRYSNLWIINSDGSDHRPLTSGKFSESSPRWSPDGSQIIYISDRDGSGQIYRRWMDTGQTAKLTNLQNAPGGLNWSPDGKLISFTALVPEAPPTVPGMLSPPPGAKWAEPAKVIDKLVYRFDQYGYLKPGYIHIFVVPAEGGTPRQISNGKFQHGGPKVRASDAVWTRDGKQLLMATNRHPDYERHPLNNEIYQFSLADGSVKALTDREGPDSSPVVSPDGRHIAYLGYDDRYQGYQVTRLYVMNSDGTGSRLISGELDRDVASPRWSPDGKGIFFVSIDQGNSGLHYYSLEGNLEKLAKDLGSSVSAYSGGEAFTVANNGTIAYTHCTPEVPGDIAVIQSGGAPGRVITSVNEDLLVDRALGEVEEIWYDSSVDSRKIHGWIIKPPEFDSSKKYPLILEIHGGPFADYGNRFDLEKQLFAAKDYVVVYTNPRGSTSYGQEFGNLIHHKYPGDDFYDLDSGVDAVVEKGYINNDRVFVTGGSGGGVLTCWMVGRTNRFHAAVTVYPVINWYSFILTSDIGNWTSRYWFPGLPWDHVEHYESRSLLSVVKNVTTPTMVLTGEADYRTPMSDSEQYYQALKLRGIESTLVRMPDEPHGIRVRPSHHVAKILSIIGWFDQHMEK